MSRLRTHFPVSGAFRPGLLALALVCASGASGAKSESPAEAMDVIMDAARVRALRPDEAGRPFRVSIRGVVTTANADSCVVQDASGPVFVRPHGGAWPERPSAGEIWEFSGRSDPGEFSPIVTGARGVRIGRAEMPRPLRPGWEQLNNGGLDVEFVELRGMLLEWAAEKITLRVPGGVVEILAHSGYPLPERPASPEAEAILPGSLVRVRGVFFAYRDSTTRRLIPGRFVLGGARLFVDEPAPEDPFSRPLRRVEELLRFDANADGPRCFKIAGQVLHAGAGEYLLRDGENSLRVRGEAPPGLGAGDVVEAVGFPELGGGVPVLLEATTRRIGRSALPAAVDLTERDLGGDRHDAMRVRLEARLAGEQTSHGERVLELQAGRHLFLARLRGGEASAERVRPGARLRLTGVYASWRMGASRDAFGGFELLLDSPADIELLANGPWWTRRHTLAALAALSAGLAALLAWIVALRRTVARRTALLEKEVRERQGVEQRRLLEQERARVAQDLHDELGAGLTQIGLIGSMAGRPGVSPDSVRGHATLIAEKARELVAKLDEIVWALNPRHDTAGSVRGYLCDHAEEFFRASGIECRFETECAKPELVLNAQQRHELFLAFKEALTNIVKHAAATTVLVRIVSTDTELTVGVEDDGRGVGVGSAGPGGDGVVNMKTRLAKVGGRCEIVARPSGGMAVTLRLPARNLDFP